MSKENNFDEEAMRLPFKFNINEALFIKEQQDQLLNLVYDHQQVFYLHDEDLGYCGQLAYTIPTITNMLVYLLHKSIPHQLQGVIRKCLDTWLRQGIIRPSKSSYASHVVIMQKKASEF